MDEATPATAAGGSRRLSRPGRAGHWLRAAAVTASAAALAVGPALSAQADGIRDQEWAVKALHLSQAWRTTKGKGVTVAVLDTGVDADNPDLDGQVLADKDLVGFGARPGDPAWASHGTAMAGLIAGHGHGSGHQDGVVGVAPQAKILPVRVILEDDDPARERARTERGGALADGIRYAVDHGADVINLSLGDDSKSAHPEPREDDAVQYALGKGVPVVASAGNGGDQGSHVSYPAAYPGVIAVTAVDRFGLRAHFSTRHWYATLCAPGVQVLMPNPNGRYYEGWGTSPAAAFVSGTVALLRAAHPGLSPAQIRQLLTDTAQDPPKGGRNDDLGAGLVDPAAALKAAAHLTPAAEKPSPAAYRAAHFGPGPQDDDTDDGPGWLVWTSTALGAAFVAAAVALWRRWRPAD
ncbi:type VII secretion-associated serine protease mycosin [Streptomyces sp. NPDC059740]|uniref:type VII secretion-associated serine protease mycosin n=1 Tax=Streptomyces sp. NPDC059740 TaxID=3346926 RepID=UPI0036604695